MTVDGALPFVYQGRSLALALAGMNRPQLCGHKIGCRWHRDKWARAGLADLSWSGQKSDDSGKYSILTTTYTTCAQTTVHGYSVVGEPS